VFQRARSEEQREARRQAILGAAAAMLAEMPAAEVTLNELSRRSGLAKSNVLRYFESREAVLLELLDAAWQDWLTELDQDLAASGVLPPTYAPDTGMPDTGAPDAAAPVADRADQVALVVAASLAARPMLCDLISAQAAVLERNISPQVAAQYKRASLTGVTALGGLILRCVPELGEHDAFQLAGTALMMTSALWPHTQPSAAMLAAYAAEPDLAAMRLDFAATLGEALQVMLAGLLARSARPKPLHRAERVGTALVTRVSGPGFLDGLGCLGC
jgi:AcrR family transcriptional regulator